MGRYNGTLHKLLDSATSSDTKSKWAQVLNYLEGHTVANNTSSNPRFDSPLPPYSAPSVELEVELFDLQGPKRDESPLKIAIKSAPAQIVAALCHLGPEAARMADTRERLPIHWACRRSSEDPETEKVIIILAKCNPESLLHRDDGGRTPLHWLFWYHAPTRSSLIVKFLCQSLPSKWFDDIRQPRPSKDEKYPLPDIPVPGGRTGVPASAAIVPDARHGVLALHYAVMQGASKDALKALINEYPDSLTKQDRKGRTALAWYLGAGYLTDEKKHVCGESNDPNATPWWYVKLSNTVIQMLLNSRVARTVDDMQRTPLHWACHFYARSTHSLNSASIGLKAFQLLEDQNIQAVITRDYDGKTPLHVLFDVVATLQENDHKRQVSNRSLRDNVDLVHGGPVAFDPPKPLIDFLMKSPYSDGQDQAFRYDPDKPSSAAFVEDEDGYLPLHPALRSGTAPTTIQSLIQANPTSLIHTSEELIQTPLIHAYLSPYSAPLQPFQTFELLMAAYVTSRHGTFMDGRLALKMEDALGKYPLHYACQNQASLETIKLFVQKFPRCALFPNSEGDLPLHCLLSQEHLFEPPQSGEIKGASMAQPMGVLTEKEKKWFKHVHQVTREKIGLLLGPLTTPELLKISSSAHGMTPLHIATAFNAVPYDKLYRMLDTYPEAARKFTTAKGYEFSCMDLHEFHKKDTSDIETWNAVKELLFAFFPTIDSYRKKEELLEACVRLIRSEVTEKQSFHLEQIKNSKVKHHDHIDLSETLSSIVVPEIESTFRPQREKPKPVPPPKKKAVAKTPAKVAVATAGKNFAYATDKKKSIYDGDLDDGGYVVSPQTSDDEDDDDDFLSSEGGSSDDESASDCDSSEDGATERDAVRSRSSWDRSHRSGERFGRSGGQVSPTKQSRRDKESVQQSSSYHIEEKKEDCSKADNGIPLPFLSDVAMRIWSFFVLFNDKKNPDDNYAKQVEEVLEELDFELIERLVNLPVPDYAQEYLEMGTSLDGVTLRDVASPSPKAVIHGHYYFLGEYEFPTERDGLVLHRTSDYSTVMIRATRHVIKTQEYQPGEELDPGAAEEAIWTTGEVVAEEGGYMASKFDHSKRTVYFKLTKNKEGFDNEVKCRSQLGVSPGDVAAANVIPLLNRFCTLVDDKKNRRYKLDTEDERFRDLKLPSGDTIRLSDYPYALVYPYSDEGDLYDYFFHRGLDDISDIADLGRQVGKALKMMHEKGVIHGNLSMRNIIMLPTSKDDDPGHRTWAVSDLTSSCRTQAGVSHMGIVSHNGSAQFETGLMPPEMFVKLSAREVKIYERYWDMVEQVNNVKVDQRVVKPFVNLTTGSSYVLRCHYVPSAEQAIFQKLPDLPYQLLPTRESSDVWCFGMLLFTLCSGGRSLFPSNLKTGHLLDYESIVDWNHTEVASCVYEHVDDPLAQDILLHLLAPYEDRAELSMETVLSHPFFTRDDENGGVLERVVEQRKQESAAHHRWRQKIVSEKSETDWLKSRTVTVNCWNFDLLRKIHFSSSEIVKKMVGSEFDASAMPGGFILLPYKLSAKNKKSRLAPTTKKDVERAERMGVLLLTLTKYCQFAAHIEKIISDSSKTAQWSGSKLMEAVTLPAEFNPLKDELVKVAASHVEAFRSDPMSAVYKLVERKIAEMYSFFKEAGKAYFYLVDEVAGIPLAGSTYAPYPLEISESILDQFLPKALPFMHACVLYVRGASGGVSGLVKLIFEAAYPHIPPSWAQASAGLRHNLDEDEIIEEVSVLSESVSSWNYANDTSMGDGLRFIRDTCLKQDARGLYCDMQRVECAGSALWTTKEGAAGVQEACESFSFKDAMDVQKEIETKVKVQERQIKKLQEEMEKLQFRTKLNLSVPDDDNSKGKPKIGKFKPKSAAAGAGGNAKKEGKTKQAGAERVSPTLPQKETDVAESNSALPPPPAEKQEKKSSTAPPSVKTDDTQSTNDDKSSERTVKESTTPVTPPPPPPPPPPPAENVLSTLGDKPNAKPVLFAKNHDDPFEGIENIIVPIDASITDQLDGSNVSRSNENAFQGIEDLVKKDIKAAIGTNKSPKHGDSSKGGQPEEKEGGGSSNDNSIASNANDDINTVLSLD